MYQSMKVTSGSEGNVIVLPMDDGLEEDIKGTSLLLILHGKAIVHSHN